MLSAFTSRRVLVMAFVLAVLGALGFTYSNGQASFFDHSFEFYTTDPNTHIETNGSEMIVKGRQIFRYDTFGDEVFWGDTLQLHQAIEGSKFGGVGPGVSPKTALAVGLKVDMDALPADLVAKVKAGQVNLDDPATTLALIKLNSVVGVKGTFNQDGSLKTIGLTCAVCHSTVDDAFMPGIGHRLDGWPNRDLNVG